MRLHPRFALFTALAGLPCVAVVSSAQVAATKSETVAIDTTLTRLYRSFSFAKGAEPDWATLRSMFLEGASIVDPVRDGVAPHAISVPAFLKGFSDAVKSATTYRDGFAERIVNARVDRFGHIAHAYVTFEGFAPAKRSAQTRGVDSIQLILDGAAWKVASFTTQYENKDLQLPPRFHAPTRSRQ